MIRAIMHDVGEFHRAANIPIFRHPQVPTLQRVDLRHKLIKEEVVEELLPRLEIASRVFKDEDKYLAEVADDIVDSIYVLVGTALEFGLPLDKVWAVVQAANMAKRFADGKFHHREDGKVIKPEGWMPPDIVSIIKEAKS